MTDKIRKSNSEWAKQLTDDQFRVARCSATERAFTGEFWDNHAEGRYLCVCCGSELFESGTKYDSGTGWPSFWAPVSEDAVELSRDDSHGMIRVEVKCARCEAHLGHLFPDGPEPTGMRYCMNSASFSFKPSGEGRE